MNSCPSECQLKEAALLKENIYGGYFCFRMLIEGCLPVVMLVMLLPCRQHLVKADQEHFVSNGVSSKGHRVNN